MDSKVKRDSKGRFIKGAKREESGNWRGGKVVRRGGYLYIRKPDHPNATSEGYVAEHRLVVEKRIGRYLKRNEIVHHINGNRQDNRLKNLVLLPDHSNHMKIEWKKGKMKGSRKTQFKKGFTPWHKGKTKKEFPQLSRSGRKSRKSEIEQTISELKKEQPFATKERAIEIKKAIRELREKLSPID